MTGLLLAAGRASRFGGNKLLATLTDGEAVGLRAAARLAPAVDRLIVVVPTGDGETARRFEQAGYQTVVATDAASGMGHSIAAGVAASADSDGWLIALADMPLLQTATCHAVAGALRAGATAVQPLYQSRAGHPVAFAASQRTALLELRGDAGARAVLKALATQVQTLPCDDPGILADVDTPGDLHRLQAASD